MENYTYEIRIPFTYDVDRPTISSEETIKFMADNPGVRVNSVGIYESTSEDGTETILTINIEYEI